LPTFVEALVKGGNALDALGHTADALISYDCALSLAPHVAGIHFNRGMVLRKLGRNDEALASYDRAVALAPDNPDAFLNRGEVLVALARGREALASLAHALTLRPDHPETINTRGIALHQLGRLDEALKSYDQALALKPDLMAAFCNRGHALQELGRPDKALACLDSALGRKPDDPEVLTRRGHLNLLNGRFKEGWTDYESRQRTGWFLARAPDVSAPPWRGEELRGRRLLVFHEQGLGDVIQFVRYLPLLLDRGAAVTFLAPANLIRLLRLPGVDVISAIDNKAGYDFQCPLLSLPHWFDTDLSSIPNKVPYLAAEDELVARWKARIGEHGFKIGIAWQGSPRNPDDRDRSIPLAEFAALLDLPGVRLISLQKNHGLEQLHPDSGIETLGDFDSGPDAFIDTAAAMMSLDLIIAPDTALAHLAGALGRRTWLALNVLPNWRWLLDRDDSPWYPTVRLFRQPARNDWRSVFAAISQAIAGSTHRQSHSQTIRIEYSPCGVSTKVSAIAQPSRA
jgi:tetratricopeptide (TPR) repeat protein